MAGVEIRSDAQVVRWLFIDGRGIVVGEPAIAGDAVPLDHTITLAGSGKE
ncbi:MAG TPA: hypothetical protein VEI52_01275 [Terriglobales bacterium]|nr:hypothetical protein [Terriglobales bacterium]